MSAPTTQEMIENVENAINARMTGGAVQSYSIGGRNIQYMPLDQLKKLRKELKSEITSSKQRTTYAKFDNPS